jgi:hypothetical protein
MMTMKNAVFWDVAPGRSFVYRRSSETSTPRHIPEDGIFLIYLYFV